LKKKKRGGLGGKRPEKATRKAWYPSTGGKKVRQKNYKQGHLRWREQISMLEVKQKKKVKRKRTPTATCSKELSGGPASLTISQQGKGEERKGR